MPQADPGLYDYLPYGDRPRIEWPNGARIAFWVAPNVEFYEWDPPANPQRAPWPRPQPDLLNYGWRDYGNRVGFWRMAEVMDHYKIPGSVSLNVALCDHFPDIIKACADRGWEFFSHGIYNTRYAYEMSEDQERAIIADSIRTVRNATGQTIRGWLAPALTHTPRTLDLIAEMGLDYTCDLYHDD
ncbi:MAG: polysaccharide deacetylase family protein, partial [Elsteraceae bacterium]